MNARWTLQLRAEPPGVDRYGREPVCRLRLALKRLLRDYGLRCVDLRDSDNQHRNDVECSPSGDADR